MSAPETRPRLRLWIVSLALFVAGFVGRAVLSAQGNVAYSYPYSVVLQELAYGLALFCWLSSCAIQAGPRQRVGSCLFGFLLAIAACAGILTTIPK
jgi:peptidoglycan/LPS O-acetylase OafA/YrhL